MVTTIQSNKGHPTDYKSIAKTNERKLSNWKRNFHEQEPALHSQHSDGKLETTLAATRK